MYKGNEHTYTNTHTHTVRERVSQRLGSQSESYRGAAEPAATHNHLALPLIHPVHCTDFNTDSQKHESTPKTHKHRHSNSPNHVHKLCCSHADILWSR